MKANNDSDPGVRRQADWVPRQINPKAAVKARVE
jgi:hypothetical protein